MRNKTLTCFILFLLFFATAVTTHAQSIDSIMRVYADQYPEQKVYVHFDKDLYKVGETVWFKAYLFAGFYPATNSRNFYVELLDNNGNIVQRKIYPLIESSAAGNFELPANMNPGTYRFRGYTTWMLNFDTAFLYKKDLVVTGREGDVKKSDIKIKDSISVHFFPEGGDLVNGLESVVAFKANNAVGMPANVTGRIVNTKGETVLSFKPTHDGMGTFNLTPVANEEYTAIWKDEKGIEHNQKLPAAKADGIVLHVESYVDKKVFVLKRTETSGEVYKNLRIVAQIGQELAYRARVPLANNINSGTIPTKNAPSGIMTITVFTDDWQPVAERVVMINNGAYKLDATLSSPVVSLDKRGKNTLEINVPDTNLTNLSISITDAAIANSLNKETIISGLLLTGDLKGYVYNPAYYFSNNSDSVRSHLDLVLLTHGWRRYNWQNLVIGRKPVLKYPKDPYLSINAKVFGVTNYNPIAPDEQITAIVETKDSSKHVLMLPKSGKETFTIEGISFYDTARVFYQFNKNKQMAESYTVAFDNGLYKGYRKINLDTLPTMYIAPDTNAINRNKVIADNVVKYGSRWNTRGNVLETVVVKTKKKSRAEELDDMYASGLFKGADAYTFDMTNDPSSNASQNIFAYLQSRVAGLQINDPFGNPSATWRNSPTSFFLDEIPVDASQLSNVSVPDIAYVKVFRPPFFGAFGGGAGGAIAVYTRKGGDVKPVMGKGLARNIVVGYSSLKEFYSPDYSNPDAGVEADYRTTLYWKPFIFLDKSKQTVKVEFYNNDISKSYRVIIEGVNETGKLLRIERVFK